MTSRSGDRPSVAGEEVALIPNVPFSLVSIRARSESERDNAVEELRRLGLVVRRLHHQDGRFFCAVQSFDEAWVRRRLDDSGLKWECFSRDLLFPMLQSIFEDPVGEVAHRMVALLLGSSSSRDLTLAAPPPTRSTGEREVDGDAAAVYKRARKKLLIGALADGYPTYDDLHLLFSTELNRNLANYAGPGPLPHVLDHVVEKAEAQGWVDELVEGAARGNPGNPQLRQLRNSWQGNS